MLHELFLPHIPPSLPLSSFSPSQLKYMMVMTGYPDFLLRPELIDQEYGVSLQLPLSLCMGNQSDAFQSDLKAVSCQTSNQYST